MFIKFIQKILFLFEVVSQVKKQNLPVSSFLMEKVRLN